MPYETRYSPIRKKYYFVNTKSNAVIGDNYNTRSAADKARRTYQKQLRKAHSKKTWNAPVFDSLYR